MEAAWHKLDGTRQQLKLQETAAQELQSKCQALEKMCNTIRAEVSQAREEGELECLRAVESECTKWEARKSRLVAQLQAAEGRVGLPSSPDAQGAPSNESMVEVTTPTQSLAVEVFTLMRVMEPGPAVPGSPSSAAVQGSPSSAKTGVSTGVHVTALSQALLARQVPPLPVFGGEGDGV